MLMNYIVSGRSPRDQRISDWPIMKSAELTAASSSEIPHRGDTASRVGGKKSLDEVPETKESVSLVL